MSIMIGVNNNMKEVSNMEDKKEKLPSTSIQCEEWANAKLPKSVLK